MSRFFVAPSQVGDEIITINDKGDISHIINVLRLGKGSKIDISDSSVWEYKTEILSTDNDEIKAKILDKRRFSREPSRKITLFQSIPKQKKMDEIVQKSIELGVSEIVPVFTSRSVIDKNTDMVPKIERWNRIAAETVKQCQRGRVPNVDGAISFEQMVKYLAAFDLVLFPYEEESENTIKNCLRHLDIDPERIAVIIGPEGGFSENEANEIIDHNAISVSLGKIILRTETAGPAAIAMVMYELEMI